MNHLKATETIDYWNHWQTETITIDLWNIWLLKPIDLLLTQLIIEQTELWTNWTVTTAMTKYDKW